MKLFYLHNAYFRNSQVQDCIGPWTIAMSDLSAICIVMLIASRDLTPGPGPSSPWSPPAPSHSLGRRINCVISHHEDCQWSPGMSGGSAICQQFLLWLDSALGPEDHQNDNPSAHDHDHLVTEENHSRIDSPRPDQDVACKIMVKLVKLTLQYHGNDGPSLTSDERIFSLGSWIWYNLISRLERQVWRIKMSNVVRTVRQ